MESKNLIYIYGVNPIEEAFKVKGVLKEIYIAENRIKKLSKIIELAEKHSIPIKIVENSFIDRAVKGVHQGIVAKVKPKKTISFEEALQIPIQKKEPAFFLILDLIEDPQNFGAILRVADAAGVHAVIYQERRSVGIVPSLWKTSSGAIWHINLVEVNNIKYAIRQLKEDGIKIIGAEVSGNKTLWESDFTQPIALVVGSEGKGIRQTVLSLCDEIVKIPMSGKINSLNASTAMSILLFEALRQRRLFSK
ncbi:MAG: 23S rRNA (guanosine(2251)-2'-O)-methyltransferase RlmB [Thermodesulfovibrio sp.]|nr:23S rRNA (guanosine(2251)-2'-O)-methyltransferase RlmB [Thermodesulfovibrio sp.]